MVRPPGRRAPGDRALGAHARSVGLSPSPWRPIMLAGLQMTVRSCACVLSDGVDTPIQDALMSHLQLQGNGPRPSQFENALGPLGMQRIVIGEVAASFLDNSARFCLRLLELVHQRWSLPLVREMLLAMKLEVAL